MTLDGANAARDGGGVAAAVAPTPVPQQGLPGATTDGDHCAIHTLGSCADAHAAVR
jgi:hypothetical protein